MENNQVMTQETTEREIQTFGIPVRFELYAYAQVEATSMEEAIQKMKEGSFTLDFESGELVQDSLEIDEFFLEDHGFNPETINTYV